MRHSLQAKMMTGILGTALLILGVVLGIGALQTRGMAQRDGALLVDAASRQGANAVKAEMEVALDGARTLANAFEGLKAQGTPDRGVLLALLKGVLEANPSFIGVWTCWEPGALDGRDGDFANREGHDATGRFVPYWYRADGALRLEPLKDYTVPGAGDYYQIALRSGKESVLEPYVYQVGGKDVLMTSLVVPSWWGDGCWGWRGWT